MIKEKNILIAQGGGPTNVINQSLCGIIQASKKEYNILGALNGVRGIVNSKFLSLNSLKSDELELIANSPGSILGSTRDKPDEKYCLDIIKILKERKISKFFYIGGNDSSDSLRIISSKIDEHTKIQCIHVPKTIDNDLLFNDHTPGFGSAAKYVALLFAGINYDVRSLPGVYIGVVMGRHAGFLTASSILLKKSKRDGPHLIFLPEQPFSEKFFLTKVKEFYQRYGRCIIAVSEGIQDSKNNLFSEKIKKDNEFDAHGNIQLSGTGILGDYLSNMIKKKLKISRVRSDTLGYPQRCFPNSASEVDQLEAFQIGKKAVIESVKNKHSFSIGISERTKFTEKYLAKYHLNKLEDVAGKTKIMPRKFLSSKNAQVSKIFVNYAKPLIGKNIPKIYDFSKSSILK